MYEKEINNMAALTLENIILKKKLEKDYFICLDDPAEIDSVKSQLSIFELKGKLSSLNLFHEFNWEHIHQKNADFNKK